MLEKDILLIINPNASKGRGKKKVQEIKDTFKLFGRQCTVAYTRGPGHAEMLARKGVEYEYRVIIAAGGDGTVNEVLNGIMTSSDPKSVTMGIIPIGRGNDFAWFAGIPFDIRRAVELIISRKSSLVDVGICKGTGHREGMYFFNGAGFGFEPAVNFRAMGYRHLNGMPSYVVAFFYILFHFPKPHHIRLTIDGKEQELDTQQISVCNGRRMGSTFIMAPKASISDGVFDVMYTTHPFSRLGEILKAAISFIRGSHVSDKADFDYLNAKRVHIEVEGDGIEAHCDGEVFSRRGSSFDISILPQAIALIHGEEKC